MGETEEFIILNNMKFQRYGKFPKLRRFAELGGDHTEEGEKYLRENPVIYDEVILWYRLHQQRIIFGNEEGIHKSNICMKSK